MTKTLREVIKAQSARLFGDKAIRFPYWAKCDGCGEQAWCRYCETIKTHGRLLKQCGDCHAKKEGKQ